MTHLSSVTQTVMSPNLSADKLVVNIQTLKTFRSSAVYGHGGDDVISMDAVSEYKDSIYVTI